jgi:hypothetical protein
MTGIGALLPLDATVTNGKVCPTPAIAPNWLGRFGQKKNGHSL